MIDNDGGITVEDFSDTAAHSFTVRLSFTRMRDRNTGVERLMVKLFENDETEPYAQVFISNLTLERDILKLREYGVFLSIKNAKEIINRVKKDYTKMAVIPDETARRIESDLPGIVRHICEYIVREEIKAATIGNDELYNIRVVDFAALMSNSRFAFYSQRDIRFALHDLGYSVCTDGRLDNTVKIGGKAIKVISLYADEIADIIEEIAE